MKDFKPLFFKYKKYHNYMIMDKLKKKEFKHFKLILGEMGIKALKASKINGIQLNACIKIITRDCKRKYKLWIYCFPNMSLTAKSISVRMGTGVGSIYDWIFIIKKNNIFMELLGRYNFYLLKAFKNCKKKLAFPTKIILKNYVKKWRNFKYYI